MYIIQTQQRFSMVYVILTYSPPTYTHNTCQHTIHTQVLTHMYTHAHTTHTQSTYSTNTQSTCTHTSVSLIISPLLNTASCYHPALCSCSHSIMCPLLVWSFNGSSHMNEGCKNTISPGWCLFPVQLHSCGSHSRHTHSWKA